MEKVLFVTSSVLDSSSYNSNRVDSGDLEGVGVLRWVDDKIYRWCQNRHSAALAVNDVVFHSYANLANAAKWVLDGATADLGFMAGVVASTAIAVGTTVPTVNYSNGGYGWVQVLGYNAAVAVLPSGTTDIAAGHIGIGADGTRTLAFGTAMGDAILYSRGVMFLAATASMETPAATTVKGWVSCL